MLRPDLESIRQRLEAMQGALVDVDIDLQAAWAALRGSAAGQSDPTVALARQVVGGAMDAICKIYGGLRSVGRELTRAPECKKAIAAARASRPLARRRRRAPSKAA